MQQSTDKQADSQPDRKMREIAPDASPGRSESVPVQRPLRLSVASPAGSWDQGEWGGWRETCPLTHRAAPAAKRRVYLARPERQGRRKWPHAGGVIFNSAAIYVQGAEERKGQGSPAWAVPITASPLPAPSPSPRHPPAFPARVACSLADAHVDACAPEAGRRRPRPGGRAKRQEGCRGPRSRRPLR